ncbi:MAG: hypothetical protein ACKKL6_02000 [Candidatus Komeilibacteria bacterium]
MDTAKLLTITRDLTLEEDRYQINSKLDEFYNFISQGNAEEADKKKIEIIELSKKSIVNEYTNSNNKILKNIGGTLYFGDGVIVEINNIFSEDNYKSLEKLGLYKSERQKFIERIRAIDSQLDSIGVKPHLIDDKYEIGLSLPTNDFSLKDVQKSLATWDSFIGDLSELSGEERGNVISKACDGSIEIFLIKSGIIAKALNIVLDKMADLYIKYQTIQKNEEELKELKNKTIEAELKAEREKLVNTFIATTIKEITDCATITDTERINELQNGLNASLKRILKLSNQGVEFEVIAPRIPEPKEPEDQAEDTQKKYRKELAEYTTKLNNIRKVSTGSRKLMNQKKVNSILLLDDVLKDEAINGDAVKYSESVSDSKKKSDKVLNSKKGSEVTAASKTQPKGAPSNEKESK